MSLESICEKILKEAEEEAEQLRLEAKEKAENIYLASEREAAKQAELLLQQAEQEAQLEALRIISQARLERRLTLLQVRHRWVEKVLELASQEAKTGGKLTRRIIISREGTREERLAETQWKEELKRKWENLILHILGI